MRVLTLDESFGPCLVRISHSRQIRVTFIQSELGGVLTTNNNLLQSGGCCFWWREESHESFASRSLRGLLKV
jgi:hypothetical protein